VVLIKKRDVESYFAERKRKGMHLFRPTSRPDATGFSGKETTPANVKSKLPVRDSITPPLDDEVKIPVTEAVPTPTDSLGQAPHRNAQS
jgi:hypothetical protein